MPIHSRFIQAVLTSKRYDSSMQGVVSAGHKLSAEAGTQMLSLGGNAFDAAAAGVIAACVVEPTLTGLGAGGFAVWHDASSGKASVLDFFAAVPGKGLTHETTAMQEVEILYGLAPQLYHIGPASCALPGLASGILQMHAELGKLPRAEIFAPAIHYATEGFELNELSLYNIAFVEKVLTNTLAGRAIYAPTGQLPGVGDRVVQRELARSLETLARDGAQAMQTGELAEQIAIWSKEHGGLITREDLATYAPRIAQPIRQQLMGCYEALCPPPPSSGGVLSSFALQLWDQLSDGLSMDSPEGADLYLRIMMRTNQLRGREFDSLLYTQGLVERVMNPGTIQRAARDIRSMLSEPAQHIHVRGNHPPQANSPMTTQLSVMDAAGNAVSITTSTGIGSGEFATDTGIELSNMMGESDLFPTDYHLKPGERLTSMMSPMLILKDGLPVIATGSAGSTRIRSAILQTTIRALENMRCDQAQTPEGLARAIDRAVQTGRVHQEGQIVHLELGVDEATASYLEGRGHLVQRWDEQHLYFGGVNMAARMGTMFTGAGDERRGGSSAVAS